MEKEMIKLGIDNCRFLSHNRSIGLGDELVDRERSWQAWKAGYEVDG